MKKTCPYCDAYCATGEIWGMHIKSQHPKKWSWPKLKKSTLVVKPNQYVPAREDSVDKDAQRWAEQYEEDKEWDDRTKTDTDEDTAKNGLSVHFEIWMKKHHPEAIAKFDEQEDREWAEAMDLADDFMNTMYKQ